MPTYDYKCEACGTTFEKFQSMSSPPIRQCPSCKKPKVKRLIGMGAGLIFKGSGFYITDYRDSGYKDAAKKESGGGEGEKKTDAKPAAEGAKPAAASESKPAEPKPAESKAPESKPSGGGKARKK